MALVSFWSYSPLIGSPFSVKNEDGAVVPRTTYELLIEGGSDPTLAREVAAGYQGTPRRNTLKTYLRLLKVVGADFPGDDGVDIQVQAPRVVTAAEIDSIESPDGFNDVYPIVTVLKGPGTSSFTHTYTLTGSFVPDTDIFNLRLHTFLAPTPGFSQQFICIDFSHSIVN
jgi:hypothetical protein